MTDNTPMVPTEDELMELGHECELDAIAFGRAVLAKWGQPAHSGEPVAWKHDCAALLMNDVELWIDACTHCGKPRNAPQPVEREPLTDEQIKGLIEEGVFFGNCKEIVRAIEAAHGIGIKGGQHG